MSAAVLQPNEERDQRVADFLNDKLQTLPDLESLDALLVSVRNQHVLLRKQLDDAENDLQEANHAAEQHATSVRDTTERFNNEQRDIDRRLRIVTQSDTSDDAVSRFEASMARLRTLDVTDGYVRQLSDVNTLSEQCRSSLGKDDIAALDAYRRLHNLSSRLPALQDAAEGAAPHLVDHILSKTNGLRVEIEKAFSSQLEGVLKKMHWPKPPGMSIPLALEIEFHDAVSKLLDLQKPELESTESTNNKSRSLPLVLLPLQVMVHPLELGFKYHFEGDKLSNKLDKPEFFLGHITDKLNEYVDFMSDNLQPILLEHFRGSTLSLNASYIDATSAFITSLLPMVRAKIFAILPRVAKQPQLLSHLIHEVMSFDAIIRDDWGYAGGAGTEGWRGLAYEVLATDDWFATWLKIEKEFALGRYQEIVEAPDSFELDYDSVGAGNTKPTKAAIRVNDLLETATDHYRTLSSFSQKLRFLIDIQISIFDLFHSRLSEGLAAYLARTSRISRTSREDQASLQGVAGLETLCRVYGSAEYLEKAMRDWSDDVFFLELWTELQSRASQQTGQNTVAGQMTIAQVASRTSNTVGTDDGDASGALFDETAASYKKLRVRCEGLLTEDVLAYNVRQALGAYTRINPWATLTQAQTAQQSALPPTAELDPLLTTISSQFSFLSKALGKVPLRRIARSTVQTIDHILFDQVLLRHTFSSAGATQFLADITAVRSIVSKFVDGGVAEWGLRHVDEGARLVGLPIEAEENENGAKLGLWQVEKRMFEASGEEARGCLEELGFERLGVAEGRKVLARRVEVSGS